MKPTRCPGPFGLLLSAIVLWGAAGCGPRTDGLITISGTVTLDGKPVADGSVSVMPLDGHGIAGGGIITNGRYTADSSPGKMAVQIYAHEQVEKENPTQEEIERGLHIEQKELLPGVYNRQSKLRIEVTPENRKFDFNLTSDGAIPAGMGADET